MTLLSAPERAVRPPPRHHEPAIEQRVLQQHDLQVVQLVMEGACLATAMTSQQCALLAHDLPNSARFRLIEQLCGTLQRLTSEQEGSDTAGLSGKDLLAAALERDASLAQAHATVRAQQKELAQLRVDNLTMHAQLIEREAQLAWPSISKASRQELAAKHLPQLQMAALQVPLATTAKSISPWTHSSSSTGRLPSHRPSITGQRQQQQLQKPQRRSYNSASQDGLRMWTPPATPSISGVDRRGGASGGLGECELSPFGLDHRPGSRCESSRGDSRPVSRGLYSR